MRKESNKAGVSHAGYKESSRRLAHPSDMACLKVQRQSAANKFATDCLCTLPLYETVDTNGCTKNDELIWTPHLNIRYSY